MGSVGRIQENTVCKDRDQTVVGNQMSSLVQHEDRKAVRDKIQKEQARKNSSLEEEPQSPADIHFLELTIWIQSGRVDARPIYDVLLQFWSTIQNQQQGQGSRVTVRLERRRSTARR